MSEALVTKQKSPMETVRHLFESRAEAIAQLVPQHLSPERLIKVALNSIAKTPKLQECSPSSLLQCLVTAAELGLEPGGALGHAYLVPFKGVCTLIIGYRGFIELMHRAGGLASIRCVVVHEKDVFSLDEGIEQRIVHRPYLDAEPGEMRYVYCVAKLTSGAVQVETMSRSQVDAIRRRSRSADGGPWVTDYEEMAKKTVLRRAAKYLPLSSERLEHALEHDNDVIDGQVIPDATDTAIAAQTMSATERAKGAVRKRLQIGNAVEIPAEVAAVEGSSVPAPLKPPGSTP